MDGGGGVNVTTMELYKEVPLGNETGIYPYCGTGIYPHMGLSCIELYT